MSQNQTPQTTRTTDEILVARAVASAAAAAKRAKADKLRDQAADLRMAADNLDREAREMTAAVWKIAR